MTRTEILNELLKYRYAHRGLHHKPEVPENSLMAFGLAVEHGFGIEFDVHLTRDGKLAVMHDSSLRRTTSRREDHLPLLPEHAAKECKIITACTARIEDITLEEAKQFPLEESDERIPEFRELLELVDGRVPLIIELKPNNGNHKELADKVMAELHNYKSPNENYPGIYCIESFNSFAVLYMKKAYPEVVRGQLGSDLARDYKARVPNDPREGKKFGRFANFMVRDLAMNRFSQPDFVAYNYAHRKNKAFRDFKGAKVFYTIKKPLDLEIGEKMGVTCIFERFTPESPLKDEKI